MATYLGEAIGQGEINTKVLAFYIQNDKTNLERVITALRAKGIWAVLWAVHQNKFFLETDDFVSLKEIEETLKELGL